MPLQKPVPEPYTKQPDLSAAGDIEKMLSIDWERIRPVVLRYPMKITPYFSSLIKSPGDPLGMQVIPDPRELDDDDPGSEDPLFEERQSPAKNIVHRYPDRILFLVSSRCAIHCRYCMRKRIVGRPVKAAPDNIDEGISYIRRTKTVREVLLSGGDPLMLSDNFLGKIIETIRSIPHIQILRVHTRVPCAMPDRITPDLIRILKIFFPTFLNVQFNHPDEITGQSAEACRQLADAGIPLGSQTVLLRGVNDNPAVMERLFTGLLAICVRPYYLHHPDLVKGTGHFRTSIDCGLKILSRLQGRISGMAIPRYMIDLPGGGGKIPLSPDAVVGRGGGRLRVKSFNGAIYEYPEN